MDLAVRRILKVKSLARTLDELEARGVTAPGGAVVGSRGNYAVVRDPDGRAVVLTEVD